MEKKALVAISVILSVVVTLPLGIALGHYMAPSLEVLQAQINDLNDQIDDSNDQIDDLQIQLNQRDNQIQTLQNQIDVLNESYIALNGSYTELSGEYEDLLFHYDLLNKPASNFTTVGDLNITFTIDRTTYYYEDSVSGNVTITYLDGTAFEGAFILYILHLTKEVMSTTASITIDGFTEFYLSPPVFQFGPGNYKMGISSLSDADGYVIESEWQVFPSVQLEAK